MKSEALPKKWNEAIIIPITLIDAAYKVFFNILKSPICIREPQRLPVWLKSKRSTVDQIFTLRPLLKIVENLIKMFTSSLLISAIALSEIVYGLLWKG